MKIKNIIQEDFANYKVCSLFVGFPSCNWKCERDCGLTGLCQNAELAKAPNIEISVQDIVKMYVTNPLSKALVCGGLEPFDSWHDLLELITEFRNITDDPVVLYTGYTNDELATYISVLKQFSNIIVKFGRFVPDKESHYDDLLGIRLASPNQYAERIS